MWNAIIYHARSVLILTTPVLFLSACQTAYYETMEKLGYHKRELLVDSVEDARESQEEAKEQFKSALDTFIEVVNFEGGELQEKYDKLIGDGLTPIKRWGTPEDIGRAVAAIASDALPFSTGEVINVDGGFHLRRL